MSNFTKQVKVDWIKALKSGKFIQTHTKLRRVVEGTISYCCIGVLAEIHPDLKCAISKNNQDPYIFLAENIGKEKMEALYRLNDKTFNKKKPDYSNVISVIEEFKTN